MKIKFSLYFLLYCSLSRAQNEKLLLTTDSSTKEISSKKSFKKRSPQTAALLSGIAPGVGQIYNGKYWKAPIVWGGLGAFGYLWISEDSRYQDAKTAYLSYQDTDPLNNITFNGTTNPEIIQSSKNVYRNQRDMYLLFGVLFYGLNILDAAVDAHFTNFDVSDDLSLNFDINLKSYQNQQNVPSLTLNFALRNGKKIEYKKN